MIAKRVSEKVIPTRYRYRSGSKVDEAKLIRHTSTGLIIKHAYRKTDFWAKGDDEEMGKAGYWLGDSRGPVEYLGRGHKAYAPRFADYRVYDAVIQYFDRRDRREHPDGTFDSARRWDPSEDEVQACCGSIRTPSAAYPYSLMVHCRTVEHVANIHSVQSTDVRSVARRLEKAIGRKADDGQIWLAASHFEAAGRARILDIAISEGESALKNILHDVLFFEQQFPEFLDRKMLDDLRQMTVRERP